MALQLAWLTLAYQLGSNDDGSSLFSFGLVGGTVVLAASIWAGLYLFIVAPLHDDPVAGGEGAWVTRPIAPKHLLAAKILGMILIFWVPLVLVRLPWWWLHGYNASEVGWAAAETLLVGGMITALAFCLGSLTADAGSYYRRTLGVIVVGLVGIVATLVLSKQTVALLIGDEAMGLLLTVAAAVGIHQVLSRRTGRSLVMGAVGITLVGLVAWLIPATPESRADEVAYSNARLKANLMVQDAELSTGADPLTMSVRLSPGEITSRGPKRVQVLAWAEDRESGTARLVLSERRRRLGFAPISEQTFDEVVYFLGAPGGAQRVEPTQMTSVRVATVEYRRVVFAISTEVLPRGDVAPRLVSIELPKLGSQ